MTNNRPTFVKLLKSYGNSFEVRFPKFKKTQMISRYHYEKMVNSPKEFKFI